MRISDVGYWAKCERYALAVKEYGENYTPHIAAYVGSKAHHLLLMEGEWRDQKDQTWTYDSKTLTMRMADIQAERIAEFAQHLLAENRLWMVDTELKTSHGRLDLLGRGRGRTWHLDLAGLQVVPEDRYRVRPGRRLSQRSA